MELEIQEIFLSLRFRGFAKLHSVEIWPFTAPQIFVKSSFCEWGISKSVVLTVSEHCCRFRAFETQHSVEIWQFYCYQDFTWNQVLWKWSLKMCYLCWQCRYIWILDILLVNFVRAWIYQKPKFRASEIAERADFKTLNFAKINFKKNLSSKKSWELCIAAALKMCTSYFSQEISAFFTLWI